MANEGQEEILRASFGEGSISRRQKPPDVDWMFCKRLFILLKPIVHERGLKTCCLLILLLALSAAEAVAINYVGLLPSRFYAALELLDESAFLEAIAWSAPLLGSIAVVSSSTHAPSLAFLIYA